MNAGRGVSQLHQDVLDSTGGAKRKGQEDGVNGLPANDFAHLVQPTQQGGLEGLVNSGGRPIVDEPKQPMDMRRAPRTAPQTPVAATASRLIEDSGQSPPRCIRSDNDGFGHA